MEAVSIWRLLRTVFARGKDVCVLRVVVWVADHSSFAGLQDVAVKEKLLQKEL